MSTSSFSRHGAVDLSQLAQKAKQPPAPAGAGGRPGGGPGGGSYVVQLTEETFEAVAIRGSMQHPVIVEFYSPRVATGQQLSDDLAAVAAENGGKFLLGRLNVDAAPGIVQALQLQAVPTVIALIGGQLAPLFQGVVPRDQVVAAVDSVLKAALSNGIVGRAEPVGAPPAGADDEGEEAGPDPRFAEADAALERGDFAAAEAEFEKLLQANPADAEAKAGLAQVGLMRRTEGVDPVAARAAAAANPTDVEAQILVADLDLLGGHVEDAFARLVDTVRATSGDERNRAREHLLELFEVVGAGDERVATGRRALMSALF